MNSEVQPDRSGSAYAIGILGSFLIVAALAWAIHHYTQPPPLGEDRAAVRAKALADMRGADFEALETPGWIDQAKGVVRIPIADAMNMVEREWSKDPSAARADLTARVEKATAVPPKPPEPKSKFE